VRDGRHEVLFYSDETMLLNNLTQFIGTALKAGNAAIVVATEAHRDAPFPEIEGIWLRNRPRY
jgi:hypothetical protein